MNMMPLFIDQFLTIQLYAVQDFLGAVILVCTEIIERIDHIACTISHQSPFLFHKPREALK
jgi:hypothetical protein